MTPGKLLTIAAAALLAAACGETAVEEIASPPSEAAGDSSAPDEAVRSLIRGARDLASVGDGIWPGYAAAPFGVLLVGAEVETLFCHDGPAADFEDAGIDPITGCAMKRRTRMFEPNLLAAFPAVDGVSTIVIGTPEATGQQPLEWQITLLHEHFHQMQNSEPGYYDAVKGLDLTGGDESGMWMLNYRFPYGSAETSAAFDRLAAALAAAINAIGTDDEAAARQAYAEARAALRATVSDADWRYFEFQLWQEGVARWTEITIAATADRPDLKEAAENRRKGALNSLKAVQDQGLAVWKRSAFYPVGAAEAMLLDARGREWRNRYFEEPLALGPYFETATAP